MTSTEFLNLIQSVFQRCPSDVASSIKDKFNFLLSQFEQITSEDTDKILQMTRMTILFEGFYQFINEVTLKTELTQARMKRWEHHFGTPTLLFLLSYKHSIIETTRLFNAFEGTNGDDAHPWNVIQQADHVTDTTNQTINDPSCLAQVEIPPSEVTGQFTKTHNPSGGFTTTPCDPVSQQFIEHAEEIAKTGGKVLEIGAAFGAATLAAILKGATVFCNDIDADNLAVVRQRYVASNPEEVLTPSGDTERLTFIPGALPDELTGVPEHGFDAILICRVLHFFTGEKIEESLRALVNLLSPTGKIYIVCETPFLKNWQKFIPEFQKRVDAGVMWPGEITNPADFESSGRAASLPKFVHWLTKDVLERSLLDTGFSVEYAEYINRAGQFPDDLLLSEHGKESVGAIAKVRGEL